MKYALQNGIPFHYVVDRLRSNGIIMSSRTTVNEKVTVGVILNECSEVKNLSQQILVHYVVVARSSG